MTVNRVRKNAPLIEVFAGDSLISPTLSRSLTKSSHAMSDELNTLVGGEKIRTHRAENCSERGEAQNQARPREFGRRDGWFDQRGNGDWIR